MGMISASRCDACQGTGEVVISGMDHVALYEWIEGYMDPDTPDEWLIKQLKVLMRERRKRNMH